MRKLFNVFAVFSLCLLFLPTLPMFAASIGLSPGELITEVKIGETSEQIFMFSRSDAVGELRLEVTAEEGANFLDLAGQTELVVPDGENLKPFVFHIDASDLPLGEHKTFIRFLMPEDESVATSNKIRFGLTGKIKFVVVDELSPVVILSDEPVENDWWKKSFGVTVFLVGFFVVAAVVCLIVFRQRLTCRFLSLTRKCVRGKSRRNAANPNSRHGCRRAKNIDFS